MEPEESYAGLSTGWPDSCTTQPDGSIRGKTADPYYCSGIEDEPRMNTNRHEDRWTSMGATTSWGEAPRERGRPARTTLARPRPTPRPGTTGNGARTPLRPGPCRSHGQGGRVPHSRETERYATAVHAGGTPALPGGASSKRSCSSRGQAPACRAAALPMRQSRHACRPFVDNSFGPSTAGASGA